MKIHVNVGTSMDESPAIYHYEVLDALDRASNITF